jgi:hypothetical protein
MSPYVVKAGDTLSQIAQRYGVPQSSVTGYASGNPNLIRTGEKLNIGNAPNMSTPSGPRYSPPPNQGPIQSTPKSSFSTAPHALMSTMAQEPPQTNWLAQQTQNVGNTVKKVASDVVQPAYAAEVPPPRKVFNTQAPSEAVSTPGFVMGTPDWVKSTIQKASDKYQIPTMLLSALLKQESGFNPTANSPAGAQGIAQFMPGTAKGMGVNPMDPESAIMGAAQYLRRSWDKFGKPELALAAYNAGGGAVNQYGGIPPYKETQNYVKNIMAMAGELHQSANGPILQTVNELKKQSQQMNKPGKSTNKSTNNSSKISDVIQKILEDRALGNAKKQGQANQSWADLAQGFMANPDQQDMSKFQQNAPYMMGATLASNPVGAEAATGIREAEQLPTGISRTLVRAEPDALAAAHEFGTTLKSYAEEAKNLAFQKHLREINAFPKMTLARTDFKPAKGNPGKLLRGKEIKK